MLGSVPPGDKPAREQKETPAAWLRKAIRCPSHAKTRNLADRVTEGFREQAVVRGRITASVWTQQGQSEVRDHDGEMYKGTRKEDPSH